VTLATVRSVEWDGNGSHRVTVETPYPNTARNESAARSAARRAVPHPEAVRWTRRDRVALSETCGILYTFTVSRLGREYK
jgi:hypothetical protein